MTTTQSELCPIEAAAARVRIVLVETSHPGNIGAVARAMKTMRLTCLHLVKPKVFPSAGATARAAGADDVLYHAQVHEELPCALQGCGFVVGTSARVRHLDWPALSPRSCAAKLAGEVRSRPVALVFGRENSGLTNAELELCHATVKIPTNPDYGSLNVAAAVQLLAYEVQLALLGTAAEATGAVDAERLSSDELEGFYTHLREALVTVGYLDESEPRLLMRRLRRMFNRIELERPELNILRGILSAMQKSAKTPPR